jgi:hypothetical protein
VIPDAAVAKKPKMSCPECKNHNMGLMEIDFDLRKIARQAETGRDVKDRLANHKAKKSAMLERIAEHQIREHASEVAA